MDKNCTIIVALFGIISLFAGNADGWGIFDADEKPVAVGGTWIFRCGFSDAVKVDDISVKKRKGGNVDSISSGTTVVGDDRITVEKMDIPAEYQSQGGSMVKFTIKKTQASDIGEYSCVKEGSDSAQTQTWKNLYITGPIKSLKWQFTKNGVVTEVLADQKFGIKLLRTSAVPAQADGLQCVVETDYTNLGTISVSTPKRKVESDVKPADSGLESCKKTNCLLTKSKTWFAVKNVDGAPTYVVDGADNNETLTCEVVNEAKTDKVSIQLSIEYPPERTTVTPKNAPLAVGKDIKFEAAVFANPQECKIEWFFSDVEKPEIELKQLQKLNETVASAKSEVAGDKGTSTLTVFNVTKDSVGYYQAKFCNDELVYGYISSSSSVQMCLFTTSLLLLLGKLVL